MMLAYAALLLLGGIWGSNFIYMKIAVEYISPMQIVFLRTLFGFIPLLLIALAQRKIQLVQFRHLPHFIVMSLLATSFYYFGFAAGTERLASSHAGLLSGAIPIFTLLSSTLFLPREKLSRNLILGLTLGFIGIGLSARPWEEANSIDLIGVFWMLFGALSLGISFVYAKKYLSHQNIPAISLVCWQLGLATISLILFTDFSGIEQIQNNMHALLGTIIGLGILGTGCAFLIYYYIIKKLGPVKAAGATYIAPVVAVLIGWLAGETVSIIEWSALSLIVFGVILIQLQNNRSNE